MAIQNYLKSIEVNKGNTENLKKVKVIALGALSPRFQRRGRPPS